MAYEKQTWTTGDTITANKLNYMEDGIASGNEVEFFIVHFSYVDNDSIVSDKTAEEIGVAIADGKVSLGLYSIADGGLRIVDGFSFVECFTGIYAVTFNAQRYGTRSGNTWTVFQS